MQRPRLFLCLKSVAKGRELKLSYFYISKCNGATMILQANFSSSDLGIIHGSKLAFGNQFLPLSRLHVVVIDLLPIEPKNYLTSIHPDSGFVPVARRVGGRH